MAEQQQQSQQQERKVPVLRSENSLIEMEFDSIRDKFELEMRKMEEEMSRFRSQLIISERNSFVINPDDHAATSGTKVEKFPNNSSAGAINNNVSAHSSRLASTSLSSHKSSSIRTHSISTIKTKTTTASEQAKGALTVAGSQNSEEGQKRHQWLHQLDSPLIKDLEGGERVLKLRFDVSPYEPEEILVKTIDNRLQVHAKRQESSQGASLYREYNREFLLPAGTNPELIRSSLSKDGVLTVEAPLPVSE